MFSLRTHAMIFGALLALIIGLAALGNALEAAGTLPPSPALQLVMRIVFFGLVIALALSAVPVMVKAVIAAQVKAGNADQPIVKAAIDNQSRIIIAMWLLMIVGTAIAIPAAIQDGLFDTPPEESDGDDLG